MAENETPAPLRILIVDDQVIYAEGLRTIFTSRAKDFNVVGIAENGQEAIALVTEKTPDIVLMDVRMPVMDGVEATRRIHGRLPRLPIVMLTTFDDDEYVKLSLTNGAIGYLLKSRPPAELIASIRAVRNGILQIDPAVSKTIINFVNERERDDDDFLTRLNTLTCREREVLRLLAQAYDVKSICEQMNIAEQTVRNYTSVIYSKLGIINRMDIMRYLEKIQFFLGHF